MPNPVFFLGGGVGSQVDANIKAQSEVAFALITLMGCAMPLMANYSELLTEDQTQYFIDSLSVMGNHPEAAALAAADYAKYQLDSSSMDRATEEQNNIIQHEKSQVSILGRAMNDTYQTEAPVIQLLKSLTAILAKGM